MQRTRTVHDFSIFSCRLFLYCGCRYAGCLELLQCSGVVLTSVKCNCYVILVGLPSVPFYGRMSPFFGPSDPHPAIIIVRILVVPLFQCRIELHCESQFFLQSCIKTCNLHTEIHRKPLLMPVLGGLVG